MDDEALRQLLSVRGADFAGGCRPCAVLVPLAEDGGEDCLVFERRAASLRQQPGEVCFPGGRMEPGEKSRDAALRETGEELGIPPECIDVLGPLDSTRHASGAEVYPWLGRLGPDWRRELRPNPAEVGEVFSIPIAWLCANPPRRVRTERLLRALDPISERERELLERRPRQETEPVLFWHWEDKILWGMTARVTEQLIRRMQTGETRLRHL